MTFRQSVLTFRQVVTGFRQSVSTFRQSETGFRQVVMTFRQMKKPCNCLQGFSVWFEWRLGFESRVFLFAFDAADLDELFAFDAVFL